MNNAVKESEIKCTVNTHYANMPMEYAAILKVLKMIILDAKKVLFFLYLLKT